MANETRKEAETGLTKSAVLIDPGLLVELTRSVLPYLGPSSITTVKRAARETDEPIELIRQIASHVDDIAMRELFMKAAMRFLSEYATPVLEAPAAEPAASVGGRPSSPMTPALVQRGEAALAPIIGPLAGVLVSRYA